MKKVISVLLLICLSISLFSGCGNAGTAETTTEPAAQNVATAEDIAALEKLYEGRVASYGDTHSHSASHSNSDGKKTLEEWKAHLKEKGIDFTTIVDHCQTYHMMREDWDDTVFVGGSEPGMYVTGVQVQTKNNIDYSMIFTELSGLEAVLDIYRVDYQYNKTTGLFTKVRLKKDRAGVVELIQCIKDNGGMWVYVHPFARDEYYGYDPVDYMDYWFADETGFEVTNGGFTDGMRAVENTNAYECWVKLLDAGKRIWATSGSDAHSALPDPWCLSTVYAAEKNDEGYFAQMKVGNLTAGPVGIRIAVGDTATGSKGNFAGNRVVIAAGDFHPLTRDHTYRLDVYDETGLLFSQDISATEMNYVAFDARSDAKYYRANVYDITDDRIFAVGNPVFNG